VRLSQYWLEALSVLAANRTRTLLTAIGLIIGVMAVISIQVLGVGMSGAVTGVLSALNDNTFFVLPNQQQADFTRAAIKLSDLKRAKDEVPNVVDAIPANTRTLRARYGHSTRRVSLGGAAQERFAATTPLLYGRKFTVEDIQQARHVAVISNNAATKFAITGDPTGTSIRVGEHRYTIVGLLGKSTEGIIPGPQAADIAIPYSTYEREYVRGRLIVFARVLMEDPSLVTKTEADMQAWLSRVKGGRVEYQTVDRKTLAKSIDGVFGVMTFVVALIGAVSLLVAGIGILNIMLVSVAERTREIGLRKAIGATRFQVLLQFFIEALALSAFGCLVGMVLGIAIGATINSLFIVKLSGITAPIPWLRSIGIATGFATIVTVAFGTYPAWRAATLDPIEALRYE
jgi:putative ABC transport system permease protein